MVTQSCNNGVRHLRVVITADEDTIFGIDDVAAVGTNEEPVFTVESVDVWRNVDVTFSSPNVLDVTSGCMEDCSNVVEIFVELGEGEIVR